ncbi:GNAT family N-acetyltransferase [Chitinimonas koreensis]|uniref:GNAT family N-acetyltransferase n=1 Tax=Chitinimonas koreensis TaxID=356302 RepID=UPI00042A4FD4|nr:GNAT family protein [Chitinimonas koreensis]QNM98501.1 GNAT family N-acetyltransferase [Chitinimonas koreensis]
MSLPPLLTGPRLALRALCPADADGPYPGWLNDGQVCAGNSHGVWPYGREQARDFIARAATARDALTLAITLRSDGRHVGNVGLQGIHPIYRSAEFAILLGDRAAWGQGYGLEAARLIVAHGFAALNLHRIHCGTFADNAGMLALAARLGMREEGRRVEAAYKNGRFVDVIEFGLLRDQFVASAAATGNS